MHKFKISVNCNFIKECPNFKECPNILTEVDLNNKNSSYNIDVLFIATPGKEDIKNKVVLSGKTGTVFRKLLAHIEKELGREVNKAFSPIVRTRTLNSKAYKYCRHFLLKDIKRLNPKVIVTLGALATDYLFENRESIKDMFIKERSCFRDFNLDNKIYKVLPILSPSKVYEIPSILCSIADDLRRVLGVYKLNPMVSIKNTEVIKSVKEAKELMLHLKNLTGYEAVSLDTECLNLNRVYGNVLDSVQFCYDPRTVYFLWISHPNSPFNGDEQKKIKRYLKQLFESKCSFKYWIMHNAKFDLSILLSKLGARLFNKFICTFYFSFILEENYIDSKIGGYSLKELVKKFGFKDYEEESIVARREGKLRDLSPEKYIKYATNDVCSDIQLYYLLKKMASGQNYLDKSMKLMTYFYNRVIRLLVEMEQNGINIDFEKLVFLESSKSPINIGMEKILENLKNIESIKKTNNILFSGTSKAKPLFGTPWCFDINKIAHKQLLFFNTLGLKPLSIQKVKDRDSEGNIIVAGKKFPAGALNNTFQEKYSSLKEVKLLSEYNKLKKLKTSYVKSIRKFLDPKNGYEDYYRDKKIRPNFFLTTKTGRGRASDPNSQQIPRGNNPVKKAIKNLFCAPPGKAIVSMDFMAVEVRGWGILANDLAMGDIFIKAKEYRDIWRKTGDEEAKKKAKQYGDIHTVNASIMFDVPIDKVGDLRQDSKPLTFGAIYAMSDKSLAIKMGCSVEEAIKRKEKVFSKFVKSGKWLTDIEELAAKQLYVEHPLGRRRRLWQFLLKNSKWAYKAKRLSRNSPIQGFASDVTFLGASLLLEKILKENRDWKFFNAVHDAIYLYVPIDEIKECVLTSEEYFTNILCDTIEKEFNYKIPFPLEAEFEIGIYGGELTKWNFSEKHLDTIIENIKLKNSKRLKFKPYNLNI